MTLKPLHPHQAAALDALKWSIVDGHRRPLLQAPTGSGKTVLAAHIVAGARAKGKRVAFCVPSIGLIDQTFERFVENGIEPSEMGVIQADHPWRRPNAPIQIATAQSLARRDFPIADVVVIDEAHGLHKIYETWMAEDPKRVFIGLSATPWARGLGKRFDHLVKTTSTTDLIEAGFLSPFRVFAPSHPDLSDVSIEKGDYNIGQLADVMSGATLVADVVSNWQARGEGRPTLCFAVNRAHAQKLAEEFHNAGIPVAYVDANTPRSEREQIGQQLAAGEIKVVVNIGCLTTGIDWDVRCLILARPTKSEMLFVQIIGRALRTAPGKDAAIILDHSDTHLRLGLVTQIDHDELDDGSQKAADKAKAREKKLPMPKLCGHCTALVPVTMTECQECGTPLPRPTRVHMVEGELAEFSSKGPGKSGSVRDMLAKQGKQAVYSQLLFVATERRRSKGWAAHTYRDIFGVWPSRLQDFNSDPTPIMTSWLRSRDIAYAKRKQVEANHAV